MHAFEKMQRKIISKVFFKFCSSSSYYYHYIITNNYVPTYIFCPLPNLKKYIVSYLKDTHVGRRSGAGLTEGG